MERGRSLDGRECSWRKHLLSDIMLLKNKPILELEPRISRVSRAIRPLVTFIRGERGSFQITTHTPHLWRRCKAVVFGKHGENEWHGSYEVDRVLTFQEPNLHFALDPSFRGDVGVGVPLTGGWWLIDARRFQSYLLSDEPCPPGLLLKLESLLNERPCPVVDAFWEWEERTRNKLTGLADRLAEEFHLPREKAIQFVSSNPGGALWTLLCITMNISSSPQEISCLRQGGQASANIDKLVAARWPEILTIFQELTPAQIEYLLTHALPQGSREQIAQWLKRYKRGSASVAAEFLDCRVLLGNLAKFVPSYIQRDLKIDLSKLAEKIERVPELSPAAREGLQKEIHAVKALLNAEYGQTNADHIDQAVIHLHEVELHMLRWTHALKDCHLPLGDHRSAAGALSARLEEAERELVEQVRLLKIHPAPPLEDLSRTAGELGGTLDLKYQQSLFSDAIQRSSAVCAATRKAGANPGMLEKKLPELEQLSGSIIARCVEREFREIALHGIALWKEHAALFSRVNKARAEAILQELKKHLSAPYLLLTEVAKKACHQMALLQAEEAKSAEIWGLLLRSCSTKLRASLEIADDSCPVDEAADKVLSNGQKCEAEIEASMSAVLQEALGLLVLAEQARYCVPQTAELAEGNPSSSWSVLPVGKQEPKVQTEAFRKLQALAVRDSERIGRESQLANIIQKIGAFILDGLDPVEGESLDALKQYVRSAIAAKSWPKIVSLMAIRRQRAIFGGNPPLSWLLWLRLQEDQNQELELWRNVEQATRQAAWYAQEENTHDEVRRLIEGLEGIQSPHDLLILETSRRLTACCRSIRQEIDKAGLDPLMVELIRSTLAETRLDRAQLTIFGRLLLSLGFQTWGPGGPPIHGESLQTPQKNRDRIADVLRKADLWPGGNRAGCARA